jgi:hypothetical protein
MADDVFRDYQKDNIVALSGYRERQIGGEGPPPGPPLPPSGGGGTFDGMEARVAVLESDVRHIKDDIKEAKETLKSLQSDMTAVRVSAATVTENVRHLPSKGFIVAAVLSALAFAAALTVFQGNIQRVFGVAAPTSPPASAPAAGAPPAAN